MLLTVNASDPVLDKTTVIGVVLVPTVSFPKSILVWDKLTAVSSQRWRLDPLQLPQVSAIKERGSLRLAMKIRKRS
jgi:hypothetical protein